MHRYIEIRIAKVR